MKLCTYAFLIILLVSCGKKDEGGPIVAPGDSTKPSPYPYSVRYTGLIQNNGYDYPEQNLNALFRYDTAYQTTLTIEYPDSNNIRFSFSVWDYKDTTDRGTYVRYLFTQTSVFPKGDTNRYSDGYRHHETYYTLRGDSLLIIKEDWERAGNHSREITFGGKR